MQRFGNPVHGQMGDYYTEAERAYDIQRAIAQTAEQLLLPASIAFAAVPVAAGKGWWWLLLAPVLYWLAMRPYKAALKRADEAWTAELGRYYSSLSPGSE